MTFLPWLPIQDREGGEYNSGNFVVPSNIDVISIRLALKKIENFSTPDLSVTITVETSIDAQIWTTQFAVGWIGGQPSPKSGGWTASVTGISNFAGQYARVHASQSGAFRWGLEVEIDK